VTARRASGSRSGGCAAAAGIDAACAFGDAFAEVAQVFGTRRCGAFRECLHLAEPGTGQQPGQRDQDRPVGPRQPRGLDLPLEHGDLVAQDEDLRVLGAIGAGEQGEPAEYLQHRT